MSQKLSVNNFKQIVDTFQFNKDFIKNYNKENDLRYFLKLLFSNLKIYILFIIIYLFCLKE